MIFIALKVYQPEIEPRSSNRQTAGLEQDLSVRAPNTVLFGNVCQIINVSNHNGNTQLYGVLTLSQHRKR